MDYPHRLGFDLDETLAAHPVDTIEANGQLILDLDAAAATGGAADAATAVVDVDVVAAVELETVTGCLDELEDVAVGAP